MRDKECLSYVVVDDCGMAPNLLGQLTLAVCKPSIRRTAQPGDWIIGLSPKEYGLRLVYAMTVGRVIPLGEYFNNPEFQHKKPDFKSEEPIRWMGDNIYESDGKTGFIQHVSAHNIEGRGEETLEEKARVDLSGRNVLVADYFVYYGDEMPKLPKALEFLSIGRGHRRNGSIGALHFEKVAGNLIKESGIHGKPRTLAQEIPKLIYLHEA